MSNISCVTLMTRFCRDHGYKIYSISYNHGRDADGLRTFSFICNEKSEVKYIAVAAAWNP